MLDMAKFRLRFLSTFLALLATCAVNATAEEDHKKPTPTATSTITTAPIYLPYYGERAWSLVRGSIISADPSASKTTYTIFCPAATPPSCDLSLEFPFIIVEGPDTLQFHGTYTSTYIADIECDMQGTTAATCSGYSSYKSGYTNGHHTGPTEISWTSTFIGTAVQWGTLTLADAPVATDPGLDPTSTPSGPSGMMYATSTSSANTNPQYAIRTAFFGIITSAFAGLMLLA